MSGKSIYLAGPEVFWPDANAAGHAKKNLCTKYGFTGLFPLDTELQLDQSEPYQAGLSIYRANIELMQKSDLIIANMTPFRGASMDVGTAFEMGFMAASNKPVWGYTLDGRLYADRVEGDGTDSQGFSIENFAMADNLMLVGATETDGGLLAETQEPTLENHLQIFEKVLQLVHDKLSR